MLAGQITAGTGWSRTAITAAYSAGSLAGAVADIPAGRLLQRCGPRAVMTAGSVLGAAAVAGIAAWALGLGARGRWPGGSATAHSTRAPASGDARQPSLPPAP